MSEMNVPESGRSAGGTVDTAAEYPIFYKKKVLPLDKLGEVLQEAKETMQENKKYIATERYMLESITAKHDEFVERLERKLQDYKEENASHVTLVKDELPDWPLLTHSDVPGGNSDESVKRLKEWHGVMVKYVDKQRQHVTSVIDHWFNLDKFNHGEEDACTRRMEFTVSYGLSKFVEPPALFLYFILAVLYTVYTYIYVNWDDASECTDKPGKCMAEAIITHTGFFYNRYLEFHNITPEDLGIPALNFLTKSNVI